MRCICVFIFLSLSHILTLSVEARDITEPLTQVRQDLPKESLKSRYRIRITESGGDQLEKIRDLAKEFTAKFRLTTYIVRKNEVIQLDAGDFSEKKFARQRLTYIKKIHKKARVVKSENDSILEFYKFEKKQLLKNKETNAVPDKKPTTKIEIKTIEIKTIDQPKEFSANWNDQKSLEANSALNEDYLTTEEKKIYYYLNLVRMNPKLFADTYLSHLRNSADDYESSLYLELQKMTPLPVLKPNRKLYESAKCHAKESGETGYVGHARSKCAKYFMGECCQYGLSDPREIIISLLIDKGVSSLGHRKICLGNYTELGVSIQPHKSYGVNAVLDFY
jgi:uncharacterized protein YkwD